MTGGWITEATLALARQLWDQGLSAEKIGERVGASKNAVLGLAHRRNWPRRPSPIPVNGVFETGVLVRKRPPKRVPVPPLPLPSLEAAPMVMDAVAPEPVPAPLQPLCRACQWPFGDPRQRRTFRLCGEAVTEAGQVYCGRHVLLSVARRVAA